METLSTTTALPEGSAAFVFGSFLTAADPSDLDVLLLYNPATCHPKDAYRVHTNFSRAVERLVSVPVDITLLTHMEAHGCHFLEETGCVPFTDVEHRLTMRGKSTGKSTAVPCPAHQRQF